MNESNTYRVPQQVVSYIKKLQVDNIRLQKSLPTFYNLSEYLTKSAAGDSLLHSFYQFVLSQHKQSTSQLFQDLFVLFILDRKRDGYFIEFGATNGVSLSNTYLLENQFGWTGMLAEPDTQWHEELINNRGKAEIVKKCVYTQDNLVMKFFSSGQGELSTLKNYTHNEANVSRWHIEARNAHGREIEVETVSLNTLAQSTHPKVIDYISIDTEGSEYPILSAFDFEKFRPKIFTVEHNFTETNNKLDQLFAANNYTRVFSSHTQFDAWFVENSTLSECITRLEQKEN
jgi:FkbM family methyltransferase